MTLFRAIIRLVAASAALALVAGLGFLGWQWMMSTPSEHIEVLGAHHAEPDTLLAIARIDTGMRMVDIQPHLVEDRLRRHPWIEHASVARRPTGTVVIHVEERTPAALRLDAQGRPDYYVDRYGFMMPTVKEAGYDVPLLHGFDASFHPTRPVGHEPLRELLQVLADASADVERMISAVAWRSPGDVWLTVVPPESERTLSVRMGDADFDTRLKRLQAFYEQAIRTQPSMQFEWIDVRYDQQIVTRERGREEL